MSARAIGTVTVSFGLVSIPVKLYSANQTSSSVSFNMLHKKCGSRLKQQYICSKDGEVVGRDETTKGYEFAKDQYVTFTPEELKVLEEQKSERIEISEFVPAEKVDAIYFEKAYYLGPDKGGEKAYRLLSEAMKKTGRSALAKYAARGKQYLVLLRPRDGRLVMQQLRYADEVRPFSDVDVPDVTVSDAELKLAVSLVEQIAAESFRPEAYEDSVKKRTMALIEKKVAGQEIVASPEAPASGQIIDLMDALKASLAQKPTPPSAAVAGGGEGETATERKPPKAKPPKRKTGEEKKASKKVS